MRILLDINHPAHVHQFKNLIQILQKAGHEFLITARNKDVTFGLLDNYNIEYLPREGYSGVAGKTIGLIKINLFLRRHAKAFKPDLMIGASGNCYIAQVGKWLGIPNLIFSDTEFAKFQNFLTFTFAEKVVTPDCFYDDLGDKQVRYNGYKELAYLHPNRFEVDKTVRQKYNLPSKFIVFRLVDWQATHDIGYSGFSNPIEAIEKLNKVCPVIITSEIEQPELAEYTRKINPVDMHSVLAQASLFIGESSTMAAEAAVLGVPSIFVANSTRGYTNNLGEYEMLFTYNGENRQQEALQKALELVSDPATPSLWKARQTQLLADKTDVTAWMEQYVYDFMKPHLTLVGQYDPYQEQVGGVQVYLKNLDRQLQNLNVNRLIVGWDSTNKEADSSVKREDFYAVKKSEKIRGLVFTFFLFLKAPFIKIPKKSIIHVQRPDHVVPFWFRRNKIVCSLHGSHAQNVEIKKGRAAGLLYRTLQYIGLKRANLVFPVAHHTLDFFKEQYPFLKEKSFINPPGIPSRFHTLENKNKLKEKYGFSATDKIVLYVGRIEKEKNVEFIAESLQKINAKLLIVGKGSKKDALQQKGLDNVVFLDYVENTKLAEVYNLGDVLVLMSLHEGLPTVVLEALACGVPVVCNDVGDTTKVVHTGHNGIITDKSNFKADVLKVIGTNGKMIKPFPTQQCVDSVEQYRWENVVEKMLEDYVK